MALDTTYCDDAFAGIIFQIAACGDSIPIRASIAAVSGRAAPYHTLTSNLLRN
jgi:hypothetical protein